MPEQPIDPLESRYEASETSSHYDEPIEAEGATPADQLPALFPPVYYEGSPDYFTSDANWMMHSNWEWMYSITDGSYYHVPTERFYYFDPTTNQFYEAAGHGEGADAASAVLADAAAEQQQFTSEAGDLVTNHSAPETETQNIVQLAAQTTPEASDAYGGDEDGNDYFFMDFDKDIFFYSAQLMSTIQGKTEREDRHVSKERLGIDGLSDSDACCLYTAIFDGHGGAVCAEYCVKHLHQNLMATFQSAKQTIQKKLVKHEVATGTAATSYDLGLTYSSDIEALRRGLQKAFELTDSNYLALAKKKGLNDGCTALVVLLYGPDDDGSLKLLTAHAGDCRAVVCRDGTAIRLTEDHKPNRKDEKRRIEAQGGKVVHVRGVWRVMSMVGNKVFGLSTARSIGDYHMKQPKLLVPSTPDLRIHTVDFYRDLFLVMGSDGIWDVLSDQEACDIVSQHAEANCPEGAAEALVATAAERGSTDDKTATVVYFGWRRDLLGPQPP